MLATAFVAVRSNGFCAAGRNAGAGVVAPGMFLERDDEGLALFITDALVAVRDVGVKEDGISVLEVVGVAIVCQA